MAILQTRGGFEEVHFRIPTMTVMTAVILLTALHASPSHAQLPGGLSQILLPRINDYKGFGSVSETEYSSEQVADQASRFDLREYTLTLGQQPWSTNKKEVLLLANYRRWDIDTKALMPVTGLPVPETLENVSLGVGYRQIAENDVLYGALLRVGSASDEIFNSIDETYVIADFFARVPRSRRDAWIYAIDINLNRFFPVIPGIAYQHRDTLYKMVLGIPFTEIEYRPKEKLTFRFSYIPINTVDLTAAFTFSPKVTLKGGFEWREFYYRRADRTDSDSLIEYEEKRLFSSLRVKVGSNGSVTLRAGYMFDRFLSEGDTFELRRRNDITIGDGEFISIGAGLLFR